MINFDLNHYQAEFIASKAKFTCLITGVGTGKTLALLLKAWIHCEQNPDALAMIVRKELTDLKDSTIKDFNSYFGTNLPLSKTEYRFPNGSEILFRHGNVNDISVLKNVNLSFAGIEQGEEYENAEVFHYLRQRLRRKQVPVRQMAVICNANGMNWDWDLFVKQATVVENHSQNIQVLNTIRSTDEMYYKHVDVIDIDQESVVGDEDGLIKNEDGSCRYEQVWECWTANSFINAHNLPNDTLVDWMSMEKNAPSHYKRMILNSFEQLDDDDTLLTSDDVQTSLKAEFLYNRDAYTAKILAVDIARYGNDKCCAIVLEQRGPMHWEMVLCEQWEHRDLMYTTGRILHLKGSIAATILVVDGEGMGAGVIDRLKENNIDVIEYRGGMTRTMKNRKDYADQNTEDAFRMKDLIQAGRLKIMPELVAEAQTVRYEYSSSGGKRKMVSKQKMRARGIKSPNIFDAVRMGCSQVDNEKVHSFKGRRRQPRKAQGAMPMKGMRR